MHQNGIIPIAFLSIPKSRCLLLITSYLLIVVQLTGSMKIVRNFDSSGGNSFTTQSPTSLAHSNQVWEKPEVIHYGDGHFWWSIFRLGPYIANYLEQVLLACIVQGWCPKYVSQGRLMPKNNWHATRCTANPDNLDRVSGWQMHELTEMAMLAFDERTLWFDYGVIAGIMICSFYKPLFGLSLMLLCTAIPILFSLCGHIWKIVTRHSTSTYQREIQGSLSDMDWTIYQTESPRVNGKKDTGGHR